MISTIQYDNHTNKAVIEYDEGNKISVNESGEATGKFQLYCVSDTRFQKCSLTRRSSYGLKCEYSVPRQCEDKSKCKDDNIKYDYEDTMKYDSKNCSFTLTRITANGKY